MNQDTSDFHTMHYPAGGAALQETTTSYEPVAETVIETISEVSGTDPTEIPPLYESIDPDALDDLFDRSSPESVPIRVRFQHDGYEVVVEREGTVTVRNPD
ncbi:HalOD1 output domain-containing protein [Haladaptatus sp. NG-SE-30]